MLCIPTSSYYCASPHHLTGHLIPLGISFHRAPLTGHFIALSAPHPTIYIVQAITPHSTVHIIPPLIPSSAPYSTLTLPCMLSLWTSHPTKRTSSYSVCHPTGHLIPPGISLHLAQLIPLGFSFYSARFIPPCMSSHRVSYSTGHLIPLGILFDRAHLIPQSAPYPTVNVLPPIGYLIVSFHQARFVLPCMSSYRACHLTVRVIPPGACHFAESILIPHQVRNTTLYISFHYSVFYPIVHLTLLLILV